MNKLFATLLVSAAFMFAASSAMASDVKGPRVEGKVETTTNITGTAVQLNMSGADGASNELNVGSMKGNTKVSSGGEFKSTNTIDGDIIQVNDSKATNEINIGSLKE